MKKLLLSFIVCIGLGYTTSAQNIQLFEPGGTNLAQPSYTFMVQPGDPTWEYEFDVKNNTPMQKSLNCKKTVLANPAGQDIYFCFGVNCYTPSTYTASPVTLNSGQSLPYTQNPFHYYGIKAQFDDNMVLGTSIVRYTAFDNANPNDSASVLLTYVVSPSAINTYNAKSFAMSAAFPNPAINNTNIKYDFNQTPANAAIRLFNIAGSLVKEVNLDGNSGKVNLDLTQVQDGVYFYSLFVNGRAVQTKKLIIAR